MRTNRVEVFAGQRCCWKFFTRIRPAQRSAHCTASWRRRAAMPCTEHVGAALDFQYNITHTLAQHSWDPLCPLNRLASPHLCAVRTRKADICPSGAQRCESTKRKMRIFSRMWSQRCCEWNIFPAPLASLCAYTWYRLTADVAAAHNGFRV